MTDPASELCSLNASELAEAYRARAVSCVEVTRAHLERIGQMDARVGSYISVDSKAALTAASLSDTRYELYEPAGPLDGVPLGVKDNIDVMGFRTTGASASQAGRIATNDAAVVARLRLAGVVILGKQSLFEIAAGGGPRTEPGFPVARNPWNLDYVPGGSSSGSAAAVAAGLATVAIGSDTGGSVRLPAALCGIVGYKPSAGVLPTDGLLPLAWSLDQIGPLTRTVADADAVFQVMAGRRATARSAAEAGAVLSGTRIGVPESLLSIIGELAPEVSSSFSGALATMTDAGAKIVPLTLPRATYAVTIGTIILRAEAFARYGSALRESSAAFGQRVRSILLQGALLRSSDYLRAQRCRAELRHELAGAMLEVDVIAMPTSPMPAWPVADELGSPTVAWSRTKNLATFLFSVSGQPAISLPSGRTSNGMPVGLQLAARYGEDDFLLRVARAFEAVRPWPLVAEADGRSH